MVTQGRSVALCAVLCPLRAVWWYSLERMGDERREHEEREAESRGEPGHRVAVSTYTR